MHGTSDTENAQYRCAGNARRALLKRLCAIADLRPLAHVVLYRALHALAWLALDSIIGVHVAECGFEPYERDDGLHPSNRLRPRYDTYLREHGYDAENPWEHWANSGAAEDG